ncbi:39S ribosomal protein L33, mitochondrial [Clarireedia jacksonii]
MSSPTTYFRITLQRSAIGLPARVQGVLKALGLRKRTSTVFYPVSSTVAGQIMKVKELVSVEEVDRALTKKEVREARRPDCGFWIERRGAEEGRLEG